MSKTLLGVVVMLMSLFGAGAAKAEGSAYDYTFQSIDGQELPLKSFAGKAILVVNTASQCGFTPQYKGLEALWTEYRDKGLVVLGVPSNDFGGQEPGSAAEIKDFCETMFQVDFPLTAKEVVKGDAAHPFYKWARAELGAMAAPKWNFHKYLIDSDGKLVDWFSTVTDPTDAKVKAAVEKALPEGSAK